MAVSADKIKVQVPHPNVQCASAHLKHAAGLGGLDDDIAPQDGNAGDWLGIYVIGAIPVRVGADHDNPVFSPIGGGLRRWIGQQGADAILKLIGNRRKRVVFFRIA